MIVRSLLLSLGLMGACAGLFGQQAEVALASTDDVALNNLKRLTLPAGYASKPLPVKKDNSRLIYFPGIYNQYVWNCNQASSIWTMFTYEINCLRGLNSTLPENQYSPMAVYNLLNYANPSQGVSYFDSWNLVKLNGIPGNADFPATDQNWQIWMTGYDKYYRGMKNRVDGVFAIDVGNPEGLLTLKHWINDHLDNSQYGGLANFQIGSGDMVIPQIPVDKGLEEEGQYIVTRYGPYVGHAMTFAGWNDSVRFDYNKDGRYTNHIDINGDGIVTMKDWEIGAMLVVNSWGQMYNAGKLWVMYRLLAENTQNGGIWKNAAMVVRPKKTYDPLLTVKTTIRYNQRNRLKIQVGVASDPDALVPERVMDYPCFNFQGDTLPMQGFTGVNSDLMEIGLDITPLINYFPENGLAKVFLEVIQRSPDGSGTGRVESFSVMDYTNGTQEFISSDGVLPIGNNATTRLSVPVGIRVRRPVIVTEELLDARVGLEYSYRILAGGTTGPYRFANPAHQFVEKSGESPISFSGGIEIFSLPGQFTWVMDLPFDFPFGGSTYGQITILTDGGIVLGPDLVKYPYVIDNRVRFYEYKGIFPFLGNLYYPGQSNKVTFEASTDEAILRWKATSDPAGLHPLEFALKLLPDGNIRFYYGNMKVSPDIPWISGVSAGNNLDYHLMDHNSTGVKSNTAFSLDLLNWPSWLSLESNGDLHGMPDQPGTYTFPVKVTDWFGITNHKELTITVKGGSGVATGQLTGNFQIFPNPATEVIWFQGFTDHPGTLNLTLYDLQGNQVLMQQFEVPSGQVLIPVREINTLYTGVYIYQIRGIIEGAGRFIRQ